jgi:hyperosmotically inducible protein
MNSRIIQAFAAASLVKCFGIIHACISNTGSTLSCLCAVVFASFLLNTVEASAQKMPDPVAPAAKPAATTAPAATSVKAATTPVPAATPAKEATTKEATKEPAKKETAGSASANDAAITAAIKEKLSKTPSLKDAGLSVEVKEGVATLTGTLPKPQLKGVATRVVKSVQGVKSVTNNITIPKTP